MDQVAQTWMTVREAASRFRVTNETMLKWAQNGLVPVRTHTPELLMLWNTLEAALRRGPRPRGARAHGR
jgi:hypothetical protein